MKAGDQVLNLKREKKSFFSFQQTIQDECLGKAESKQRRISLLGQMNDKGVPKKEKDIHRLLIMFLLLMS